MKIQTSPLTQWAWQWLCGILGWDGIFESCVKLMGKNVVVNLWNFSMHKEEDHCCTSQHSPPASESFMISWFYVTYMLEKNDSGSPLPINFS